MGILSAFAPDEAVRSVTEIDLDALAERGIEGMLIDVDNTLLDKGLSQLDDRRREWLERANEMFSICLVSNSFSGRRVRTLTEQFGFPGVSVWAHDRKPLRAGICRALSLIGTPPERTVMIGDQLMTDILGGNRCGLYTIWVEKIGDREFFLTRWIHRPLEAAIRRWLARRGMLPEPPAAARNDEP